MTTEPDQTQGQANTRGQIPQDSLANRLMLARAHAGHLSIREAADLCGIGRGAWTNWEKGARPVDIIEVAMVVADKLNVDREWLLFGGQLSESEPRLLRRIRRASHQSVTGDYLSLPERMILRTPDRPPGQSGSTRPGGGRRTALLPRPGRPSAS